MIVEDDYDSDFYHGDPPPPTIKSIDSSGRVIYVGTFSKSLFPSLRLGYVLMPEGLVESFQRINQTYLSGVPTVTQAVTADFMDEGMFATHVRTMRQLYAERHKTLLYQSRLLSGRLDVQPTTSGFHAPGTLASGFDEKRVVEEAAREGVITAPLSRYAVAPLAHKGVVLGFGCASGDAIRQGICALDRALKRSVC